MKTTASSYGDTNPCSGARLGIDFYANGRITGTASPDGTPCWTPQSGWASNQPLNFVHWGTYTWTQVTMDFTVASSYTSDGWLYPSNGYPTGQWVSPTGMVPWMQVCSSSDYGQAWFANAQLYINP